MRPAAVLSRSPFVIKRPKRAGGAMAQPAAKQRRRIVPEQIVSPGADDRRAQLEEAGTGSEPAGPILLQKQREQAEWAREHLGPDRKVFLDLTDVAANKEVDWRKVGPPAGQGF